VLAGVAEQGGEQLGSPVDDPRLSVETRGRIDVSLHPHDLPHAAEVAEVRLDLCQRVDGTQPCGVPAIFFVQVPADLPLEAISFPMNGNWPLVSSRFPVRITGTYEPTGGGAAGSCNPSEASLDSTVLMAFQTRMNTFLRYIQNRISQ
jgi:hypothetical protein